MEVRCPRLEKSNATHLLTHHQKCKPPRKLTLLSNFEKKKVFKKSMDKEMLLPTGFSKWHEVFLGVVQAFSLHSIFVFYKANSV